MELTEFTAAACGNGPRQFVGEKKKYVTKQQFLDHVWKEFSLGIQYEMPTAEITEEAFARKFTDYDNAMEIESGYCYCDEKEDGAFQIYLLDEEDLIEVYKQSTNN